MIRHIACVILTIAFVSATSYKSSHASEESLGIADVISAVRDELELSKKLLKEKDLDPLLFVDKFELELQFLVKKSSGVKGVDIEVLGVGFGIDGENTIENSEVQKIKLIFKATKIAAAGSGRYFSIDPITGEFFLVEPEE